MFSNIFGTKEKFKVVVKSGFESLYVGMAHDEHITKVPAGATGTATISSKGKVSITFDNIKEVPTNSLLSVCFKKESPEYNNYTWTAVSEQV